LLFTYEPCVVVVVLLAVSGYETRKTGVRKSKTTLSNRIPIERDEKTLWFCCCCCCFVANNRQRWRDNGGKRTVVAELGVANRRHERHQRQATTGHFAVHARTHTLCLSRSGRAHARTDTHAAPGRWKDTPAAGRRRFRARRSIGPTGAPPAPVRGVSNLFADRPPAERPARRVSPKTRRPTAGRPAVRWPLYVSPRLRTPSDGSRPSWPELAVAVFF